MVAFAEVLQGTSDATFHDDIEPWIDAEAMMRYFVADQITHGVEPRVVRAP